MSTDLDPRTPTKIDAFVDKQITQVQDRIRRLDVFRAVLAVGVVVLGYGLLMALLDITLQTRYPGLVDAIHLGSFVLFLGVAGYFVVQVLARLSRRINPYYAAKHLEDTVPQAKNSVINWLDLREEKLPTAIHGAVSQRAARDLKKTDADKAVNPRSNWLLFSVLGVLLIGFLILLATRPNQFSSLLQRAYAPFRDVVIGTRTQIEMLQPEKGDLIVPPDRSVTIRARITGNYPGINKPGAPRLLFRYQQADPFVAIPLEEDTDGSWTLVRKPDQVRTGFYYKVAAGDAETREFQVIARTDPRPTRFDVTYKYRPYLRLKDETVSFPNEKSLEPRIQARRGTEVSLLVHTNRKLKEGSILLETGGEKRNFDGILKEDGASFHTTWLLENSGTFRIQFTSVDEEANSSATLYTVIVEDDKAPQVVLTEPGKDVSLPANGILQLAGLASDDFGVRSLSLRLKVIDGALKADLLARAFRDGKDFRFEDGSYPDRIEYRDLLALDALKSADGKPYLLKEKMVLEYWLEARDNADYPNKEGNLGVSKSFKIAILAPNKNDKSEKSEREKAAQKQKEFEKKQDEKLAKENEKRNAEKSPESKDGKSEPKDGTGESKGNDAEADKLKKKGEDLAKAIEQAEKDESPGDAKGEPSPAGEKKDGDSSKGGVEPKSKDDKKGDAKSKPGEGKSSGKDAKETGKAGETKDRSGETDKKDGDSTAGKSRDGGKEPPNPTAKGTEKKEGASGEKGDSKSAGEKSDAKDKAASAKEEGAKSADGKTGDAKDDAAKKDATASETKSGDTKNKDAASPTAKAGDTKGEPTPKDKKGPDTASKESDGKGGDLAKEKSSKDGKVDPGSVKAGDHAKKDAASTTKGEDGPERSSAKTGGSDGEKSTPPPASAKKGTPGKEKSEDLSSTKQGKTSDKGEPALTKGNGRDSDARKDDTNRKELTPEQIAKMRELLKDDKRAQEALDELEKAAEQARDAKTKEAAKEALKKEGREPGEPGRTKANDGKEIAGETGNAKTSGSPDPKKVDATEPREGKPGDDASAAKGTPTDKKADSSKDSAKGESKSGKKESGAKGFSDEDQKAIKAVEDFLKRGGNLQLEDLARYLKNTDAKTVERAGWSKDELQQWLKAAAKHDERISGERKISSVPKKDALKGGPGSLPGFGPRDVGTSTNPTSDPLVGGRPQPPPEFREPQRIFTGQPKR